MTKTIHFHSSRGCLSYLVIDEKSKEAVLIDPSEEIGEAKYLEAIESEGATLRYLVETHTHADHISLSPSLRRSTHASLLRHQRAPSKIRDISLSGGEQFMLGESMIKILATPGHTDESISLYIEGEVFTGDTLLIGGTGRTDFQAGDSESLYQSLHFVLSALPGETVVRPGHDYHGLSRTILANELGDNPRLRMCQSEFVSFMNEYHPAPPELFDRAVAENSRS